MGDINLSEGTNTLNIALTPITLAEMFYGHVRSSANGAPIANALIQVYGEVATFTDRNGYYEVAVPYGYYTIVCYGESHWAGLKQAQSYTNKLTEVNFDLQIQPGVAEPMRLPRRLICCRNNSNFPTQFGGKWEVIFDEGYADNIYEWLSDPSIEYAYLIAEHGSPSELWLKCRESSSGCILYASQIKQALKNRQPFKLVILSGCNTVDVTGSPLAYAFGGSALGQSKPFFRAGTIEFLNNLNKGLSAYQAYAACGSYVTDPTGELGLLAYYGDTRPGFRLV